MRLEINYKKKTAKSTNTCKLNNMLLNNKWITEEVKEEIKRYLETNDNADKTMQNLLVIAKDSNTNLTHETRKISNEPKLTPKATREGRDKAHS